MSEPLSSLHTQPSLLVRIRDSKDVESWKAFVQTYGPLIYGHGRRQGLQDADASDLTQEVLADVAHSIGSFDYQPARGRFRNWLWMVTHRRLAKFLAQRRRLIDGNGDESQALLGQAGDQQPSGDWTAAFHAQVLRTALARVRPYFAVSTWKAFERVWLQNQEAADAARDLNVPIDAVYSSKSRVLRRLEEEVRILAEDIPHYVPLS